MPPEPGSCQLRISMLGLPTDTSAMTVKVGLGERIFGEWAFRPKRHFGCVEGPTGMRGPAVVLRSRFDLQRGEKEGTATSLNRGSIHSDRSKRQTGKRGGQPKSDRHPIFETRNTLAMRVLVRHESDLHLEGAGSGGARLDTGSISRFPGEKDVFSGGGASFFDEAKVIGQPTTSSSSVSVPHW